MVPLVRRVLSYPGQALPNGYLDLLRQVLLFCGAYFGYQAVRGIVDGQKSLAFANGHHIIDLERSTHTFFEPDLQSVVIDHRWLIDFANFMYMNSHFVVTTTFLAWLYLRRNENFYFVRNMFMVAMGLALVGYVLYPTAPPRLYPEFGIIDTLSAIAHVNYDSARVGAFVNPYAAVPSMHCAFALMIAVPGFLLTRHIVFKAFWAIYPLLVFWVVIVTGNHYWFDGAVGAAVAAVSALVAQWLLARARPEVWSFAPAPGEARA
jgi:membrane-associated phospholipid phosphatase